MKYDYLIVGAGLYGCVFAHEMKENGKKCLVIDRRNHIAGNIYTEKRMGINVHKYGAHIFHTSDEEVWNFAKRFTKFNNYVNSPIAIYENELYNLPFNMNTFSRMWNIKTPDQARKIISAQSREAVTGILKKRKNNDKYVPTESEIEHFKAENLEEQGLYLGGKDIFEKLVKGYTEKQWGRSCNELPAFIIKRLPFRFTYDNNYFNDLYQGIPVGGYTSMTERMLDGTEVMLSTDFYRYIRMKDGMPERPFVNACGDTFDRIVFTGMIDEFFGYKLGILEYRSLRFEDQEMADTDNYQGNAVVNYTERKVPYTRVIEHKHFEFSRDPGTIITREFPMEWNPGDEPYYPLNDDKNNKLHEKYVEFAKDWPEVIFGGRLGQYKYYNMDQVIREALNEADKQLSADGKKDQ